MNREEALKIVRENYPHFGTTEPWLDLEKALATLIPELRESEDERIRKWIANYIHRGVFDEEEHPMALKAIEWLEKQKEQNLIMANSPQLKEQKSEESKVDVKILKDIDLALRGLYDALQPKNEWSEEDEEMIKMILGDLEWERRNTTVDKDIRHYDKEIAFLKSLRPSWKPSEHQINILKAVKEYVGRGSGYWGEGLGSLIEDLEKLM